MDCILLQAWKMIIMCHLAHKWNQMATQSKNSWLYMPFRKLQVTVVSYIQEIK